LLALGQGQSQNAKIAEAVIEKNEEKADEVLRQATGIDDQKGMQGYTDRSKIRDVMGTKFMRELILK